MPEFHPDLSVALVGIRAAGKTTLAIMAASALNKKIVDTEAAFECATKLSTKIFTNTYGNEQCRHQQGDVLRDVLEKHRHGYIIVCSWMDRSVQSLLRQFSTTNPVIHVTRARDAVFDCLNIVPKTKLQTFWRVGTAFFRTCSNLEFFNVSETVTTAEASESPSLPSVAEHMPPHLALKRAERHLMRFLKQIYPHGRISVLDSTPPLINVRMQERLYTHAVSVSINDIVHGHLQIDDASAGADAYQLNVDLIVGGDNDGLYYEAYTNYANQISEAVGLIRRSSVLPIIIHLQRADPSSLVGNHLYPDLLAHALSVAPEMVTVDLGLEDIAICKLVMLKRCSKLIGCYSSSSVDMKSWSSWNARVWIFQYQRAMRLGCDVVQFIRPASSINDNFEVALFRSIVNALPMPIIPLSAYNSGLLGRHSACLNPVLTLVSPKLGSDARAEWCKFPLTSQDATKALYASFLYDPMKLYVFGHNVEYSLSPAMHNSALEVCGIPHLYEACSTNALSHIEHLLQDPFFGGASIGLPFKVECIALTHCLSPHAQAIGAVNTLIPIRQLKEDGTVPLGTAFFHNVNRAGPVQALYGENTDWIGIQACIHRGLSPANAIRPTTCALIIGAGGMARAAVYALLQAGVSKIAIYNRSVEHGRKLATHFSSLLRKDQVQGLSAGRDTSFEVLTSFAEPWQSGFRLPSIVISCIPTHSIGNVPSPELRLPESWLANQTGGVIIELGYKTLDTPLLRQAVENASRGWVAMDGLDLLPDQGFAQFELFTGKRAPRGVMRRAVFENYPNRNGRSNAQELQRRLQNLAE